MKIEIVVSKEAFANTAIEAIKSAAHTGKIGDGKIFVYDIEHTLRIRTDEKDNDAL